MCSIRLRRDISTFDLIAQYAKLGWFGQNVFVRHDIVADDTSHLYGQVVTKRFACQGEIIRNEIRFHACRGAVDVSRHDHPAGDFGKERSQGPLHAEDLSSESLDFCSEPFAELSAYFLDHRECFLRERDRPGHVRRQVRPISRPGHVDIEARLIARGFHHDQGIAQVRAHTLRDRIQELLGFPGLNGAGHETQARHHSRRYLAGKWLLFELKLPGVEVRQSWLNFGRNGCEDRGHEASTLASALIGTSSRSPRPA